MFCDEPVLPRLIGGDPDSVPDQLRHASPLALLPFGVPQEYVVSSLRYPVTPARPLAAGRTTLAVLDYPMLAKEAGDSVTVQIVPDADHFDFLKPSTKAWPASNPRFRESSQLGSGVRSNLALKPTPRARGDHVGTQFDRLRGLTERTE